MGRIIDALSHPIVSYQAAHESPARREELALKYENRAVRRRNLADVDDSPYVTPPNLPLHILTGGFSTDMHIQSLRGGAELDDERVAILRRGL